MIGNVHVDYASRNQNVKVIVLTLRPCILHIMIPKHSRLQSHIIEVLIRDLTNRSPIVREQILRGDRVFVMCFCII